MKKLFTLSGLLVLAACNSPATAISSAYDLKAFAPTVPNTCLGLIQAGKYPKSNQGFAECRRDQLVGEATKFGYPNLETIDNSTKEDVVLARMLDKGQISREQYVEDTQNLNCVITESLAKNFHERHIYASTQNFEQTVKEQCLARNHRIILQPSTAH